MRLSSGGYGPLIVSSAFLQARDSPHIIAAEEERERRRGFSEVVPDGNPPSENAPDLTLQPDSASGEATPPLPASDEQPRISAHPPPNDIPERSSPGTTAEEPPQLPPSSIPAATPQPSTDTAIKLVCNPNVETDITGDRPQPTPSFPVKDELQDPPTSLTTPEQPNSHHPPSPATTAPLSLMITVPTSPVTTVPPSPTTTVPPSPTTTVPPSPMTTVLSSRANTVPPVNGPTPVTDSLDCFADAPARIGVFTVDSPPAFITPDTIEYLEAVPGGEPWINMVNAYFKFEQLSELKDVRV